MDFRDIIEQHIARGADVTLCAKPFPVSKVEGLGLMRVDDDLSIKEFAEKPKDPAIINSLTLSPALEATLREKVTEKHCLASMGIYVFNRSALAAALENSMTDFGREVIPALLDSQKMYAHIFEGYWEDIGTVKAFFETNLALAQPLPSFNFFDATTPVYSHYEYLPASKLNKCHVDNVVVADGCILTDSAMKHCLFGIRSYVGEASDLEDVVMMGADYYETPEQIASNVERGRPNLGVGKGCYVRGAIIDKNTRIGDGSRLTAAGKADGTYAGGAVVIRDGVLVVPKGATIPAGTIV
jgi:glucose-1-phosphate adenylyltransferase